MPQILLEERNVFIYDATVTPPTLVAGCRQFDNQPTTNSELYMCLSICFREPREGEFRLMAELDQSLLPNDGGILRTGNYFVVTSGLLICVDIMLSGLGQPAQWMRVVLTEERARYRLPSPRHSPNHTPTPRVRDISLNLHSMLDSTFRVPSPHQR